MGITHHQIAAVGLDEVAAATPETLYWTQPLEGKYKIVSVYFTPYTARALDATNFTTYSVENGGVVVASNSTEVAGPAIVAGTAIAQTFAATGVGTALEGAQGETLAFKKVDSNAGLALDGSWTVGLEHIRP